MKNKIARNILEMLISLERLDLYSDNLYTNLYKHWENDGKIYDR